MEDLYVQDGRVQQANRQKVLSYSSRMRSSQPSLSVKSQYFHASARVAAQCATGTSVCLATHPLLSLASAPGDGVSKEWGVCVAVHSTFSPNACASDSLPSLTSFHRHAVSYDQKRAGPGPSRAMRSFDLPVRSMGSKRVR